MGNKKTVGSRMVSRLKNFAESLEETERISERFTCRTIRLNLEPESYDPERVKETRRILNASQAIFAQFIGMSPKSVQEWEQGVKRPQGGACRLMDEIRRNPSYWQKRLKECAEPLEAS